MSRIAYISTYHVDFTYISIILIWTSLLVDGHTEEITNKIHHPEPKCEVEGFLPHPTDSTKFYRCIENGRSQNQNGSQTFDRHDFVCPTGTRFDMKISSCNFLVNTDSDSESNHKVEEPLKPAHAKNIYFEDQFFENPNETRWIISTYPGVGDNQKGQFGWSPGTVFNNAEFEKGLLTLGSDSYYAISTKTFRPFSTKNNKVFILQFSTKETVYQDCAGSFIKVFDCSLDPLTLGEDTRHLVRFGPDQCGGSGTVMKLDLYHEDGVEFDSFQGPLPPFDPNNTTHVYTLIIYPEETSTFEILYDGSVVKSGNYKGAAPNVNANGWDSICGIGFQVYQSQGGTVFDNILMTSDRQLTNQRVREILRIVSN